MKKLRLYCDPNARNVSKIIQRMPIFNVSCADKGEILWMRKGYLKKYPTLRPDQWINHFPNEGGLANKGRLYDSLQSFAAHEDAMPIKCEQFLPKSYRLTNDAEREAFLAQLPEEDSIENPWIFKPANLSEGAGVRVIWQFSKIKNMIERRKGRMPLKNRRPQAYIAQKYLQNPLLLNRRKSDIRIYWLLASIDPLMILIYTQGVVRVSALPFSLRMFKNPLIHITNPYRPNNHPNYDPDAKVKWSFAELQECLLESGKTTNPNYITEEFLPRCHDIIQYVVTANRELLSQNNYEGNYYALYGADIMLDNELNPWLAEVQQGPSLYLKCPVKENVIPPMIAEMINIMTEIRKRKLNNESLQHIDAVKNFQWIINEAK